ncbi:uncharacterized protein [Littorina saxatilis]|uniref:uncharacterized protein isoform X2 n=1 Tax=Littorina saxatilis TaxID=31220 RepID=UPI0038B56C38
MRSLDHHACLALLPEGHEDMVMDTLLSMFPKLDLKELDFLMRVMLPEAIFRICSPQELENLGRDRGGEDGDEDGGEDGGEDGDEDGDPSRNTSRKRTQAPDAKRQQKPCPVPLCPASVVHLPRHFSQVHKDIPQQDIDKLLQKGSKRKLNSWTCPVDGCGWRGDRLDKHLSYKTHGFDKGTSKAMAKLVRQK